MALPPSQHQHCTDEAQKAETALSAVSYIYIYICFFFLIYTKIRSSEPSCNDLSKKSFFANFLIFKFFFIFLQAGMGPPPYAVSQKGTV